MLVERSSSARRLSGLLTLTRLADGRDVQAVVEGVARTVAEALDFRVVAVNLHRPAWDDFEVVHVHGDVRARDALLGHREPYAVFRRLLDERWEQRGAYLVPGDASRDVLAWTPDAPDHVGPDAWDPEDMLLVPLGEPDALLGVLAVDDPVDGRRPDEETLDLLVAAATHATQALRAAQAAHDLRRHRVALDELLAVSAADDLAATLDRTCRAVQEGLAFEKAALFLDPEGSGQIRVVAHRGCETEPALLALRLPASALAPLHAPEHRRNGCLLVDTATARAVLPSEVVVYDSANNGRGPRAWQGHWLLAPVRDDGGGVLGYLWADDPEDRLVPDPEELTTLALFADQVAQALRADRRLRQLRHLAEHDPLTGVRNRRGLEEHIAERLRDEHVAVLVCDLDHFKRVNDVHGHAAGDEALARFGRLLSRVAAEADGEAFRTGGEEFCLVLRGLDAAPAAAHAVARRLAEGTRGGELSLTLSVGLATSSDALPDVDGLLAAADQALYVAKRRGRDLIVPWTATLADTSLRAPEGSRGQLDAVMFLAEALDLRDGSTAMHSRTVADLAERIGAQLSLAPARVRRLRIAGALHDLGKVGVADAVLRKPGALDETEWAEMQRHPQLGARILAKAALGDVAGWVLAHHERMDGGGYPRGLRAERIPLEARILAVADAYEAMTADRPYREAMTARDAQAELRRCSGTQFDPQVVQALLEALGEP